MATRTLPRLARTALFCRAPISSTLSRSRAHPRALSTTASATATPRLALAPALLAASALGTTIAYAASANEPSPSKEEIAAASAAIESLLDEEDDLGPTLVRLAWHASGTYDKVSATGGSDGATMRFPPESEHAANAGLHVARNALEPIKKLFPGITYADLWTLAGAVAIEHMGGPTIVWRPGRRDAADGSECTPDGRLPDGDKGQVGATIRHVREIFTRQGFSDREMVALIGAHALGRCHTDRSGYQGPWTRAPTTFSNLYFKALLENTWTLKQWDGPDQFEDPTGDLMMLPADMALVWDREFRKYVVDFAKDEEAFFKAFAAAFQKLEENGVKAFQGKGGSGKPWYQFW